MALIEPKLFFGFPINDSFSHALMQNKPEYNSLFIQEGDAYLKKVTFHGMCYLGKYINNEVPLNQLESLEIHIFSLLKKLVANHNYSTHLVLFALPPKDPHEPT